MKKCMVEIVYETLLFVVIYDLIIILYVSLYGIHNYVYFSWVYILQFNSLIHPKCVQ